MTVRFHSLSSTNLAGLQISTDAVLLHGEAIDDRGTLAISAVGELGSRVQVLYDAEEMQLAFGDVTEDADNAEALLEGYDLEKVVLEATSLDFAAMFSVINALVRQDVKRVDIVYAEPASYKRSTEANQFALSETIIGYKPIPHSIIDLTSDDLESGVFFLGFESERLDRALEEHQMISSKDIKVVFGLPAFHPGWELNSIIPHLPRLEEQRNLQIAYCSANDPEAAFECLEKTRDSLGVGKRMFVAPIGTKPCGIAAAVFASVYPDQVGLLFDHPRKRVKRSEGASLWHRFTIQL
jgi:hypothetical protein